MKIPLSLFGVPQTGGWNLKMIHGAITHTGVRTMLYQNMILMSAMTTILFLGGWHVPFGIDALSFVPGPVWFALKTASILFFFIWVRATFPRFRYDQLMRLGWKVFLPLTLIWLVVISGSLFLFDAVPQ